MGIDSVRRIPLPTFASEAGDLTVIESLPFELRRAFFIYNVPGAQRRGSHANRDEHVLVAVAGSLELLLDDGTRSDTWLLGRPDEGLYVPPLVWRDLSNFTVSTICLVLSSRPYSEDDYIRDYDQFLTEADNGTSLSVPLDENANSVGGRKPDGEEDRL